MFWLLYHDRACGAHRSLASTPASLLQAACGSLCHLECCVTQFTEVIAFVAGALSSDCNYDMLLSIADLTMFSWSEES